MDKSWEDKWIEDIDYLTENLISRHKNLFFNVSKEEFQCRILKLKSMINDLDYEEMKVELSRLVASIKDAHTCISFPINRYIPLKFYYFNDGIYIVRVTKDYKDLLYKKVTAIEDVPIADVLKDLSEIISYENRYFFKAQCVKYLQGADILYGLMICDSMDKINISLEDKIIGINTVKAEELIYIENPKVPLYAQKSEENYWFTQIKSDELYIKYNCCREQGDSLLEDKIHQSIKVIEDNNLTKVTIDLRNNLGGDSTLLEPLIDYIKNSNTINVKSNLKVVIGRETFSSGLLNAYDFKQNTNAIIIGEPSGGKPNCYGEILRFTLPNSKFNVSYSTEFYKLIPEDSTLFLYPDEIIDEKIEDYFI